MKTKLFILTAVALTGFLFISSNDATNELSMTQQLQGVWEMEHQYMYENNEITDTMYTMHGYRQVKMYSGSKVMWTRFNPNDPNEWFGFGTYLIKDGWLEERLEYASNPMMKIVDTTEVFRFELEIGPNSFSQIALDNNGHRYYSENYKRIE